MDSKTGTKLYMVSWEIKNRGKVERVGEIFSDAEEAKEYKDGIDKVFGARIKGIENKRIDSFTVPFKVRV